MPRAKIFFSDGSLRMRPPKPAPTALTSLGPMVIACLAGCNIQIRTSDPIKWNILGRVGDNAVGPESEIQLIDLQTSLGTYKVYYTSRANGSNIRSTTSIRIVKNGSSSSYTNTATVTAGPLTISINKQANFTFQVSWSQITNIVSLGGLLPILLKRIAANNGVLWDGGTGMGFDGITNAVSIYGLSRNNFVTGIGVQSVSPTVELYDTEILFIQNIIDNTAPLETDPTNIPDINGLPLSIWSPDDATALLSLVTIAPSSVLDNSAPNYILSFNDNIINYIP